MPSLFAWLEPVRRAVTHPVEELNRWQRSLRYFVELMGHCWRQLNEDRAEEMAAALTYRTIFSLIPLVVLGLVVFRIFGGFEVVQEKVLPAAYAFFGVPDVEMERYAANAPGGETPPPQTPPSPAQTPPPAQAAAPRQAAGPTQDATASPTADTTGPPATTAAPDTPPPDTTGPPAEAAAPPPAAPANETVTIEVKTLEQEIAEREAAKSSPVAAAQQQQENQQVRGVIQKAINELIANLSELNFASIGVVGVLVFIYAAMTLALAVEYDFNIIFKAPTGRPWHLRLPVYWSMLTLGSGLLGLSLYLSGRVIEEVKAFEVDVGDSELHVPTSALNVLSRVLAFLASWGFICLLYTVIPSTRVRIRPALLGSFVAATMWECAKISFQLYVNRALPYSELYGALGLIPLFLFWVYISWLILLFGLELTYAQQMMRGNRYKLMKAGRECDTLLDPRWVIPVMASIGASFKEGKTTTAEQLAQQMTLPVRAITQMIEQLRQAGMLHRVEEGHSDEDPGYSLAVPPDQIGLSRLLELSRGISMQEQSLRNVPGRELLAELSKAEHQAADRGTLATLLASNGEAKDGNGTAHG